MSQDRVIGEGGWGSTAARVLGVWILSLFAFAAVFLEFLSNEHSPVLQWVVMAFAVLIAPAYSWREYRVARQRNQSLPAGVAKIMAILLLAINTVSLALVWLMADGLKHLR